ncbi:hypothetical protein ppKF707_0540 [Metapseudomonas furukawaii]|uniref:Uncharacterized protein n=1 Tax=Metapseudomonas furukawaii TaxID=1149133 RepID=A0AAD1BZX0_METFU|nr:hypothetical protein ppKF707_0540 [Pseudomonas furukawaii]BAU73089.1 hypothetical protein KF707C_14010 [Pseudomonas furukawaii]
MQRVEDASPGTTTRRLGFMRNQVQVPDDFDAMGGDAILRRFEGSS